MGMNHLFQICAFCQKTKETGMLNSFNNKLEAAAFVQNNDVG